MPCAEKYLYFVQSPTYTFVVGLLLFCQHVKIFFFSWIVAYVFRLYYWYHSESNVTVFTTRLASFRFPVFPFLFQRNIRRTWARTHTYTYTSLLCILMLVDFIFSQKYDFLFESKIQLYIFCNEIYRTNILIICMYKLFKCQILIYLNFIQICFDKKNDKSYRNDKCNFMF